MRDEGAKAIAAALKDTKITHLNLSWNKMGDEGVKAIAAAFKDTKISHLNLSIIRLTMKVQSHSQKA
tara:strand:- start:901 stop:1101 length:201 start_codon:yes stop_codon:yes gene_type:complete